MTTWTRSTHADQAYDFAFLAGVYVNGPTGAEPALRAAQIGAVYALLAIHREMATPWWRKLFRLKTRSPQVFVPAPAPEPEQDGDPWDASTPVDESTAGTR